jgi:hypothetical protein
LYCGEEKYLQDFVGKPKGERQLGKPRLGCDVNIEVNLKEIG